MTYFRPAILAMNTGTQARKMATAPFLALDTAMWSDGGRIGSSMATESSEASVSDITRRNSSAFFRPMTVRNEEMATRISTRSAVGGGKSSGAEAGASVSVRDELDMNSAISCIPDIPGKRTTQYPRYEGRKNNSRFTQPWLLRRTVAGIWVEQRYSNVAVSNQARGRG